MRQQQVIKGLFIHYILLFFVRSFIYTAGNDFAYFAYASYTLPIANFDAYTMPIRKKTIFDECLYERTKYEGDKK